MHFSPLTVSDYNNLKIFFYNQRYQLSTYSLFSLIVWSNSNSRAHFAITDDTLIISNEPDDQYNGRHLILPLSHKRIISPDYLYNLARNTGFMRYCFVPETYLIKHGMSQLERYFKVTEQSEFADYIYLTENLIKLKGNKYSKQRNLIHQFQKAYLDKGTVSIEMVRTDNLTECLSFLDKWCDQHGCDHDQNESMACEKVAAINALNNIGEMESKSILIRINGTVRAFGISSYLTDNMGVLNFEKADSNIKGLYQFLDNQCATRLFSQYKYINKESDMNLPNLAQSKNAYNPVMKLKSYCLTLH